MRKMSRLLVPGRVRKNPNSSYNWCSHSSPAARLEYIVLVDFNNLWGLEHPGVYLSSKPNLALNARNI